MSQAADLLQQALGDGDLRSFLWDPPRAPEPIEPGRWFTADARMWLASGEAQWFTAPAHVPVSLRYAHHHVSGRVILRTADAVAWIGALTSARVVETLQPSRTPHPASRTPHLARASAGPWMTLFEAIAWIATGGASLGASDRHPGFVWPPRLQADGSHGPPEPPLVMPVIDAERRLLNRLAAGAIVAHGVPGLDAASPPEAMPEAIPAIAWDNALRGLQALRSVSVGSGDIPVLRLSEHRSWWFVRLRSGEVEAIWPFVAGGDARDETARAVKREKAPDPSFSPPDAREPFDFEKAKAEFLGRKVHWDRSGRREPAPTVPEIMAIIAERYHGTPTQKEARALAQLWPKEFRRTGPRKRPPPNSTS